MMCNSAIYPILQLDLPPFSLHEIELPVHADARASPEALDERLRQTRH